MKQTSSITTVIRKFNKLFSMVENIDTFLKSKPIRKEMCVVFCHDLDRNLIATRWSDQYYSVDDRRLEEKTIFKYEYSVTSKGISFISFDKGKYENWWFKSELYWSYQGDDNTVTLLAIPNHPPLNYKGTMYMFHQEKIKEILSILPAWAYACMNI